MRETSVRQETETGRTEAPRAAKVPRSPIVPLPNAPIEYPAPAEEPEYAPQDQPAEPATVPAEPVPVGPGAPA